MAKVLDKMKSLFKEKKKKNFDIVKEDKFIRPRTIEEIKGDADRKKIKKIRWQLILILC